MAIPAEPARRGSRFTALYVALWAVLALGALVYLVAMALKPDLASRLAAGVSQDAGETQADATRTAAEIEDLKRSLASVRTDIGTLKDQLGRQDERSTSALRADVAELSNALAQREERERSLSARLAAVEGWQATYERTMHTASAGGSAPQMVNGTVTGSVHDNARRAATAKEDGASAQRTTTAAAATPTATKTTATPAATKAAAPAGPVALQLASSASLDELRLSWLRISSTNGGVLPKLEPRYVQAKSGTATSYRLIIGPLADAEEGARVCAQMKAKKLGCSVSAFGGGGQPL
jgi:hypothetical protein